MIRNAFAALVACCLLTAALSTAVEARLITETRQISICFAGDCTLGTDLRFGYYNSFVESYDKNGDLDWYLGGVAGVFKSADFATANLETTLTGTDAHADKEFVFKGYPVFAKILRQGGVGAVNIANNHTMDYLREGYDNTLSALKRHKVGYYGNGYSYVKLINGVKAGFLGYTGWYAGADLKKRITDDISELRDGGVTLVFVYFHWGIEGDNYPNATQTELARHSIDAGADLVWASHPHVVQGIERYKGRYIAYSLGNFCYGGHKNPADKDTFILRYKANVGEDGVVKTDFIEIIPCSVSSVKTRNDYRPTIAAGEDFERIKARLKEYSKPLDTELSDDMFTDGGI